MKITNQNQENDIQVMLDQLVESKLKIKELLDKLENSIDLFENKENQK